MALDYSIVDGIIKTLISGIDGDKKVTAENFSGKDLKQFIDHQDVFWDGLVQFMQNEDVKMGKYGLKQADFLNEENAASVVEFINDHADLIENFLDDCLERKTEHWNKSFDKLIETFNDMVVEDKQIGESIFTINDITAANAGNSFRGGEWVKPWQNVGGYDYAEVRGNDKNREILDNPQFLQYTHRIFDKFIRLLMPKYDRTLAVEDLNRNFWVIGQVLAAILEFLFNDDNPYKDVFDGILDEIAQLWENLLYLWIGFIAISQKKQVEDVQFIVMRAPADDIKNFEKRDGAMITIENFISSPIPSLLNSFKSKVDFLKDIYTNSTIVVLLEIPIYKAGYNDWHFANCFGLYVYNRRVSNVGNFLTVMYTAKDFAVDTSEPEWQCYPITCIASARTHYRSPNSNLEIIDDQESLVENPPLTTFIKNGKEYSIITEVRPDRTICAARTKYNLSITFSGKDITDLGITMDFYDVAYELFGAASSKVLTVNLVLDNNEMVYDSHQSYTLPQLSGTVKVEKGIYWGEVLADFNQNIHFN